MNKERTLVIVPTYNERENVPSLVQQIFSIVPEVDVLLIDDNSPDATANCAEELFGSDPRFSIMRRVGPRGLGRSARQFQVEFAEQPALRAVSPEWPGRDRENGLKQSSGKRGESCYGHPANASEKILRSIVWSSLRRRSLSHRSRRIPRLFDIHPDSATRNSGKRIPFSCLPTAAF